MTTSEPQFGVGDKSDLKSGGWIDRLLPAALRPYAYLMRLDRPIGTWLLLLPGWWSIALSYPENPDLGRAAQLFVLFGLGAVIMRGAGCAVNDLWDRDFDARVARTRTRPLVTGAVRPSQAVALILFLSGLGLLILLSTSPLAIAIGVASLPFIALYPAMKRITWWPQAFLGLTFNFGALMGWAAMTNELGFPAVLLYSAGFFWTLGYDTIYAAMDTDDDARIGVKSTARLFGPKARKMVAVFYTIATLLLGLAVAVALGLAAGFLTAGAAAVGFAYQVRWFNPNDPALCLRLFKFNRDQGGIILIAILVFVFLRS